MILKVIVVNCFNINTSLSQEQQVCTDIEKLWYLWLRQISQSQHFGLNRLFCSCPPNNNVYLERTRNAIESFHLLVSIPSLEFFTGLIFNLYPAHTNVCSERGAGATQAHSLSLIALQTNQDF